MNFGDLQSGEKVFLDANTLVYHFGPHPVFGRACHDLIQRIERQDVFGFTSTHILTEAAHRLMMIEAAAVHGWSSKVKQRLQSNPAALQGLTRFRTAIETVLSSEIQVLGVAATTVLAAADVSRQSGLLSNDALLVAVMQGNGLTHLASHDTDLDRAPGILRYAPI